MTNFWAQKSSHNTGKIIQSCTLFSKPRVCQSLSKMPNPAQQLVPPQIRSGYNHRWCEL